MCFIGFALCINFILSIIQYLPGKLQNISNKSFLFLILFFINEDVFISMGDGLLLESTFHVLLVFFSIKLIFYFKRIFKIANQSRNL